MALKKKFILSVLVLLLCLPACAKNKATSMQGNDNPLSATGLLAHPNENMEEILLRAHNWEPEAMILATTGYTFGVGGFPKNLDLADAWNSSFQSAGSVDTIMYTELMLIRAKGYTWQPGPDYCDAAKRSFIAPLFKQAGLFDIEAMCPGTGEIEEKRDYPASAKYVNALKNTVIESVNRPITKLEAEALRPYTTPNESIRYLIATAGNKNASKQEQTLNLLRFIALRKMEPFPESAKLQNLAMDTLTQINSNDIYLPASLEIIRKAHQGDPVAARQMAENYRSGAMGFSKSKYLVMPWLELAASAGDKKAVDSLALYSYTDGLKLDSDIWKNAQIALHYGSEEMKDVFTFIIKETEKKFAPEELQNMQKSLKEELKHMEESGYHPN